MNVPTKRSPLDLASAWLLLGITCLGASGLLSAFLAVSRMPWLTSFFPDPLFFRRVLVVHVDLGVSVWFTAFPISLYFWFFKLTQPQAPHGWLQQRGLIGFLISLLGLFIFTFGGIFGGGDPILSNYVPVVQNQFFFIGLALYLVGIVMSLLGIEILKTSHTISDPLSKSCSEITPGFLIGVLYFIFAAIAFAASFSQTPKELEPTPYFEVMMWAGGHLLQFINAVFMLISWTLILSHLFQKVFLSRKEAQVIFYWLGFPLLTIPFLLFLSPLSPEHRESFTYLMRWGIFPPVLFYLFLVFPRVWNEKTEMPKGDIRWTGFLLSIFLILSGFVFGFFVLGPDLRLPGHYHSAIAAVSVAYTVLSFILFTQKKWFSDLSVFTARLTKFQTWSYALGQWIFSAGMVWAGAFGMARKVYGVEQQVPHPLAKIGMAIMGIGGAFALLGGVLFFVVLWKWLKQTK